MWNTAVQPAADVAATAAQSGIDKSSIMVGLLFYGITMTALTWWEEKVLPDLQDKGIMPTIPGELRHTRLQTLSKEQRELPWLTPHLVQFQGKGLPRLEDILQKPVRIGIQSGVAQYIKAHSDHEMMPAYLDSKRPTDGTPFDADEFACVCRVSPEFTEHYGKRVYLCKKRVDLGEFSA